jgi:hypothetical protein
MARKMASGVRRQPAGESAAGLDLTFEPNTDEMCDASSMPLITTRPIDEGPGGTVPRQCTGLVGRWRAVLFHIHVPALLNSGYGIYDTLR